MAPVSRTSIAHDILNCKECARIRFVKTKGYRINTDDDTNNNNSDMNGNYDFDIQHASKYTN